MNTASLFRLDSKTAAIVGAGSGIGEATARMAADLGAHVICLDVNAAAVEATANAIKTAGGKAESGVLDIREGAAVRKCFDDIAARHGALDIAVCTPAINVRKKILDYTEEEFDRVMAVNIKGVWQMSRAVAAALKEAGGGSIINIASATVFSGSPLWMHYVASKGAVIAMSRTMARELGRDGTRVNVIAPGFTLTEASLALINDARSYGVDRAALKRNAEVDDITGGALYLASSLSGFVTGQTIIIDGGKQFI